MGEEPRRVNRLPRLAAALAAVAALFVGAGSAQAQVNPDSVLVRDSLPPEAVRVPAVDPESEGLVQDSVSADTIFYDCVVYFAVWDKWVCDPCFISFV